MFFGSKNRGGIGNEYKSISNVLYYVNFHFEERYFARSRNFYEKSRLGKAVGLKGVVY